MPTLKQQLANQLTVAVAPLLGAEIGATGQLPKRVANLLRKFSKQLAKRVHGRNSVAPPAAEAMAKRGHRAVVRDLTAAVQPYLGAEQVAKTPKKVRKTLKRLAAQVVKQGRKHAKLRAKSAERPPVIFPPATRSVLTKPQKTAKPSPIAAIPTRRRTATQTSSPKTSAPNTPTPIEVG